MVTAAKWGSTPKYVYMMSMSVVAMIVPEACLSKIPRSDETCFNCQGSIYVVLKLDDYPEILRIWRGLLM